MQLLVHEPPELGGKTICIDTIPKDTLAGLKQKIKDKCAVPEHMQLLIFKSKLLQPDESFISSHGLYASALIQLRINKNAHLSTAKISNQFTPPNSKKENKDRIIITGVATIQNIKRLIQAQKGIKIYNAYRDYPTTQKLLDSEHLRRFFTVTADSFSEYSLYYTLKPHDEGMDVVIQCVQEYFHKETINGDICDKYLPTSYRTRLLIYGYIHNDYSENNKWNMVPIDVMNLCHKYYHESLNMFMLTSMHNRYLYKWSCINVNDDKHVTFDIYDMDNPNVLWSNHKLSKADSVVIVDDVLLPNKLQTRLNKLIKPNNNINYFGGRNNSLSLMFEIKSTGICYGVAFDYFNNIYSNKTKINGYKFPLPYLVLDNSGTKCHALYSRHFGLMTLFENQHLYNLEFNFEDIDDVKHDEWRWKVLSTKQKDLTKCARPLIVNNQDMFVMDKMGNCWMFDFWGKTWNKLKTSLFSHRYSGTYCDRYDIYVGGGCERDNKIANRAVECYDTYKDKWVKLPSTKFNHLLYPTLWKTGNLLFIASNSGGGFDYSEYLDLRIGEKWESRNCQTFNFQQNIKLNIGQTISCFVPLNAN